MRKLTTEEFVAKARAVHGNRYDYSKAVYEGSGRKLEIVCPEHGSFWQTPCNHLSGQGCPACTCHVTYDQESYLAAVRAVYGDGYDLSKVVYRGAREKVVVTCPEHGDFEVMASAFLHEQGCPKCGRAAGRKKHDFAAEQAKRVETVSERYGVDNVARIVGVTEKSKRTCLERYGVERPLQNDELMAKFRGLMLDRFGVPYAMQSPELRERHIESCRANGTFGTSQPEETLYSMLCKRFGESDVERQFHDERYPFACDFHVTSLDLFCELNAHWSHGGRWFDVDDVACQEKLVDWETHAESSHFYRNAISVWTGADVRKRQTAADGDLGFVVFWNNDLSDAESWVAAGCPLRKDWQ